jgi:prolyl-tRNA editing enzyme YbaK/EbsC (Cys-tRNA(Pro) deacylase)
MREKVINSARDLGLQVQVKRLEESTATVEEAARAVDCKLAQIAKSLVFVADGDPVLCIASGSHRVDVERLAEAFDVAEVRVATPAEVRAATGFAVGGVPPFGHGLPVVMDEGLLEHDTVWAAGGDGHSMFEIAPAKLAECTRAVVAPVGA